MKGNDRKKKIRLSLYTTFYIKNTTNNVVNKYFTRRMYVNKNK